MHWILKSAVILGKFYQEKKKKKEEEGERKQEKRTDFQQLAALKLKEAEI